MAALMTDTDLILTGCRAVTGPTRTIPAALIGIRAGHITTIVEGSATPTGRQLDLTGLTVIPGFIDLHIHGVGGADAHAGQVAAMAAILPRFGVTSFLPTLAADSEERTIAALTAIGAAMAAQTAATPTAGARVLGAHLEGPFLNPARAGAIAPEHLHPADPTRLARLLNATPGVVRLMTLAPDVPGALALIPLLAEQGIVVSLGHTAADYACFRQALAAGARHTTHLFNAMTGLNHRAPGPAGAALTDERATIELIADGVHIHPAILALAIRVKGPGRTVLVSDAVGPAGLPPGDYEWFGHQVHSDGTAVRLPDGTLAGSLGTLDRALQTMLAPLPTGAGQSLAAAATMLATTPAQVLGLPRLGRIRRGYTADLVAIDDRGAVRLTLIGGQIAYDARQP